MRAREPRANYWRFSVSDNIVEVAVGVLIREDGRMLLSSRPEGKPYAGYWEFPGGKLEKGETINALKFLRDFKATGGKVALGKNVVVIGGGNTAMDTARAAKRTEGVEHVYLVYRRTKRYMPAAEDELLEVLEEGVEFKELLSPVSLENGKLLCKKMELGSRKFRLSSMKQMVLRSMSAEKPASMIRQWRQVQKAFTLSVTVQGELLRS